MTILVAAEDIEVGRALTKANLAQREVPEAYVHQASVKRGEENVILGRPVTVKVSQGQPILWSDFDVQRAGTTKRLSAAVQKGNARSTMPVDLSGSLAGMLRPGDHVDIMGTFAKGQGTDWATVTLLQNVLVIATGDMRGGAEGEAETLGRRSSAQLQLHHRLGRSRGGGAAGVLHAARPGEHRPALAGGHRDRRRSAGQELRRHLRVSRSARHSSGVTPPRRSRRSKPNDNVFYFQ